MVFPSGVGFHFHFQIGMVIALAVIFPRFSGRHEYVLLVMLNSGNSLKSSLRMLMLDAVTPVLALWSRSLLLLWIITRLSFTIFC